MVDKTQYKNLWFTLASVVSAWTCLSAWSTDVSTFCETGRYVLAGNYDGARLGKCEVVSPTEVRLLIQPEDDPPINPSPWYSFHVRASSSASANESLVVALYYETYEHRYVPKVSRDGITWSTLPESETFIGEDGSAKLIVKPDEEGFFVSAQEILNNASYDEWVSTLVANWHGAAALTIGYSIARRPVTAVTTNSDANKWILLLGRQHPPEVSGAIAMRHFVDRLAEVWRQSCSINQKECAFFRNHNLVIVPNLNSDGVSLGHWRHGLGSVDLNRDWGPFTQPETSAVIALVDHLVSSGKHLRVMLDFHSTHNNVLYTQTDEDLTDPPNFASSWIATAMGINPVAAGFTREPREVSEQATSKNYFFRRFGVPSITYELADEADRWFIRDSSRAFADALIAELDEEDGATLTNEFVPCEDFFCFLVEVNRASLVVLAEENLLNRDTTATIARALRQAIDEQELAGSARPTNYLDLEARLIQLSGPEATNIHIGRPRQCLHGVVRRMLIRERWLRVAESMLEARRRFIQRAEEEAKTVIPAFTHGVPSQPTTYGHQLLAFSAALSRDIARLREGYARVNRSSFGSTAGNTSKFPINRHRLAGLLGFQGPIENAYDANFVASVDMRMELASILKLSATTITQYVENVHSQQRDPMPWIYLAESKTSGSSMPQKRSPRPLGRLRTRATEVIGSADTISLFAHNVDSGMYDYRLVSPVLDLVDLSLNMYEQYAALVVFVVVDSERARAAIDGSFATTTGICDTLFREYGVPFRTAHGYVSALIKLARDSDRHIIDLSNQELQSVYVKLTGTKLPISADSIHQSLNASQFVMERVGFGDPQPDEMDKAVQSHWESLIEDTRWLEMQKAAQNDARWKLDKVFAELKVPFE